MRSPIFWALLLFPAGILAQGCPTDCQCSQPRTVFCISRRSHTVPQGLPQDTANLYVFENGIHSLHENSFTGLPALQLLDLSQNQISSLPRNVFQPLTSLSNLDLSSNQLHEISNESFHGLRFLERLYLDRNKIRLIHPQAFDSLESLLELKLQDNQLHVVPPLHLPTLLLLDISRNRITTLEPGTFHINKLESLKIAGLNLDHLDEELLQKLHNLHELDVSDNLLSRVPGVLKQLRGLTKLSLAGNAQISQLHLEDFQELPNLQELDISNLNLNHLPKDFFSAFPRLKAVTAAENPFNCICQMSWFVNWLSTSKASLQKPEETRCHFPPKNAGRLLQHLEYTDFGCPTTTTTTTALKTTSPRLATPVPSSGHIPPEPSTASPTPRPDSSTLTLVTTQEGQPSPETRLCPPYTCLNGGACQVDAHNHLECICPIGFLGLRCEIKAPVATLPAVTLAPTQPKQIAIKHIGSTSLKVDLQNYIQSKSQLKGIRLTYSNLSGPDKRPVTLNLPATLAEYTVRELRPNSSYHICIGPLGDKDHEEDFCVEAHTLHLTHQQHAPVTQSRHMNLTLMVVPAVTAVLLIVAAITSIFYYVRRRRRQGKTRATLGASSSPLELEGVKACLENGDLVGQGPKLPGKTVAPNGLEYEVPLMEPQCTSTSMPRGLKPSYF
ncbi:vasorin [Eublepharis macularius]|uniref:Vasorin n=1 Tax=Eublepharis macularius TaxID=481883 RepID=A0AA97K3X6_EUBMA|nr:vasorin [Eublepharis macularius]XP_054849345.1 vasorin [Eublepharis macularius]XP_054849346.1 vasorin [Eublepharis macularius]